MATRHVLFWFDVEDCTVPQSDDAAKRIAATLTAHGVRATMKLVGQKARVLRERVRYKAIDALAEHAIGFHSDMHGGRPQPAEYMAPLDRLDGQAEFERRERRGRTCRPARAGGQARAARGRLLGRGDRVARG